MQETKSQKSQRVSLIFLMSTFTLSLILPTAHISQQHINTLTLPNNHPKSASKEQKYPRPGACKSKIIYTYASLNCEFPLINYERLHE